MSASAIRRVERKNNPHKDPRGPLDFWGEIFMFRPTMGAKGLRLLAKANANPDSMFDAIEFLLLDLDDEPAGGAFERFMGLDFETFDDMVAFMGAVADLYGLSVGESSPSPQPSPPGEGSSSSISSDTTASISTPSVNGPTPSGSFT